ncbi:hypothetical protein [Streptococcus oriscaviae]|uniref:Uncharacterized protein n=1 Tax=Streptococcus oriscaviae TaxID=2781599 RepID=A0ABX7YJB3_9STRE|nr:hypothetical protein [Streptococcus oriscaviae]QUE53552.1 hypothetical protein INT76_06720 [Streptococcus oriscaviae]
METYNYIIKQFGDPLLAGAVAFGFGFFLFKQKKPTLAIGTLLGGAGLYYIMHNVISVLQALEPFAKAVIDFFS